MYCAQTGALTAFDMLKPKLVEKVFRDTKTPLIIGIALFQESVGMEVVRESNGVSSRTALLFNACEKQGGVDST